jgi:hypothetical protein
MKRQKDSTTHNNGKEAVVVVAVAGSDANAESDSNTTSDNGELDSDVRDNISDKTTVDEASNTSAFTFPGRLMDLLNQNVAKDAMWWLENGDGFCVVPKPFTEQVLNTYFQGTKFESFTRKLNRW